MTDSPANRPAPSVCRHRSRLPVRLASAALNLAANEWYGLGDVQRLLQCGLEARHDGGHHGLVLDLEGVDTGAVWARWLSGETPTGLLVLRDCGGHKGDGEGLCEEFTGHPGTHTWELADRWQGVPA